jgi:hypothetical protein
MKVESERIGIEVGEQNVKGKRKSTWKKEVKEKIRKAVRKQMEEKIKSSKKLRFLSLKNGWSTYMK